MKQCPECSLQIADDNAKFCPGCGSACSSIKVKRDPKSKDAGEAASLIGDKNLINESTIIGKQDKFEASNITIHNNITEDHSNTTVVCTVSGKRIYLDKSVECPECGGHAALEYYIEVSKRCEKCEKQAHDKYRAFAIGAVSGPGPVDAACKLLLDAEAERLKIDAGTKASILRSLQQRPSNVNTEELSSVQRSELDAAVKRFISATDLKTFKTIAELHEISSSSEVDYWYYLARAIVEPAESVKSYEEELTDNYWQRYWGFLAYCDTGSPKGSAAVDRVHTVFGEREDDIRLAEVVYYLARGFDAFERSMLERASELAASVRKEHLSKPLVMVYDALQILLEESIRLDKKYSPEITFVFLHVFRAGKYIQYLYAEQQRQEEEEQQARKLKEQQQREDQERRLKEEQLRQKEQLEAREREERRKREEQDRRQQEQQAAEQARQQKQAELAAERSRRMEQEMARLAGKPTSPGSVDNKAFAGYDTAIPAKKSKVGRNILIGIVIVIVLIGILFLIPAPESLQ